MHHYLLIFLKYILLLFVKIFCLFIFWNRLFAFLIRTYSLRILPIHAIFSGHGCCKNGLMNFNLAYATITRTMVSCQSKNTRALVSENSIKDIGKLKRFMQDKDYFFSKEAFDLILKDFQNEIND